MKNLLTILAFIISLSGCATKPLDIGAEIVNVKSDHRQKIIAIDNGFQDEILSVTAIFSNNKLALGITNISDRKALIHWNESALVDIYGKTHKIYFINKDDMFQPSSPPLNPAPTILSAGSSVSGNVLNIDSEIFIPGTTDSGYLMQTSTNNYTYMPGYSTPDQFINGGIILRGKNLKLEDEINRNLGKSIELIFAVENDGRKFDYTVEFKINHVGMGK